MLLTETKKKQKAFTRIDWRGSLHDNHSKKYCGACWGVSAGRTHIHDLRDHGHIPPEELFDRLNLPVARKITPEPADFAQMLKISGTMLSITNAESIPIPPWPKTASLF